MLNGKEIVRGSLIRQIHYEANLTVSGAAEEWMDIGITFFGSLAVMHEANTACGISESVLGDQHYMRSYGVYRPFVPIK